MKAKPSKPKSSAGKPAKRALKKPAKAFSARVSGAKKKPAAARPVSKKPSPAKAGAKAPGRLLRKPLKEARAPRLAPKSPPAPAKPKPPIRRVPKPASIAARRKERAHFRELLLKKRQDLMRAYAISKGDSQAELDNGTEDYVDYAVNSYAREFLLSLTELDRKHLLLVEEALNRIDRGEYGYCQQCGEDVALKRLEVQPWARHCVRCQELEEKGLLPQSPFHVGEEEEPVEEPEEVLPADEEAEPEVEDEVLDDDPLVVDGDDSDE
jgi:RNA polymerase-binding transcription factor